MSARVIVFLDYQNVYRGARRAFHQPLDPHWYGQVHPVLLAQHITADSPFDRHLTQVRIYRGQPAETRDPRGYAASRRQHAHWRSSPQVHLTLRTLRYPHGWPNASQPADAPPGKGIDVALALDFAVMAVRRQYDVGILMSTDTDLKPALEFVAGLTGSGGPRAEVAAWSGLPCRTEGWPSPGEISTVIGFQTVRISPFATQPTTRNPRTHQAKGRPTTEVLPA
jgi:hypothetical protein